MKLDDNKLAIIVCTDKKTDYIKTQSPYLPIHLGKALHPEVELDFIGDDTGDNISEKNSSYNELTGIYWAWKNLPNTEYIGVCHYRRYFDVEINSDKIDALIGNNDILTVKAMWRGHPAANFQELIYSTTVEDAWIFLDTVMMLYPEREDKIKQYFFDSRFFYPFNMFIMRRELFNEYCEFLFPLLSEMERRMKNHEYTRQRRCIGYCGEWSLGLFMTIKGLKHKELPWVLTENLLHTIKPTDFPLKHRIKRKIYNWLEKNKKHKHIDLFVPDDIASGLRHDGIILSHIK